VSDKDSEHRSAGHDDAAVRREVETRLTDDASFSDMEAALRS